MEIDKIMNIGVIGAGSWGTSLANLLAKKGYSVILWAYEHHLVEQMFHNHENNLFLPGVILADNLHFSASLDDVAGCEVVLLVSPSQVVRSVMEQAVHALRSDAIIVSASKGIENDTLLPMSDVLKEVLPVVLHDRLAFLSGPTFAKEVALEQPSAVVVSAENNEVCDKIQQIFNTTYFRVYTNNDVIGTELGGALKNVIALAAGVSDGLGYGYNTRAALITRGLAEIKKIGVAMGAKAETFAGLAGMGDLVLTCTGDLSRNRAVGIELGKGRQLKEVIAEMSMVAEGVKTTLSTYQLAAKLGVEVPIIAEMYALLYKGKDPRKAVVDLMQRELKSEYI